METTDILKSPRILRIARAGDPILSQPALLVNDPTLPEIRSIVRDIESTLKSFGPHSARFAGIAAPQVYIPLRIIFVSLPRAKCAKSSEVVPLTVMINPSWRALSDEMTTEREGCLSLPNLKGEVPRYCLIEVCYQNFDGEHITLRAEGYFARVIQHECDHLEGILYTQRMKFIEKLSYVAFLG